MDLSPIERRIAMLAFEKSVKLGMDLAAAEHELAGLVSPENAKSVRVEYEMAANIIRRLDDDAIIAGRNLAWYKPGADGKFFAEVRKQLLNTLPAEVVEQVSARADQVLGAGENPRKESFQTRGLVIGYVQSGKTTSFISLAAKAADAGYKLIIILSGITDNLRTQTQDRVDSTLVGDLVQDWRRLTTSDSDFAPIGKPDPDLNPTNSQPVVVVIKKNPSRLQALVDWLDSAGKPLMAQTPIMIIDDEADQATPNTEKERDRTSRINGLLLKLAQHNRTAYVAYTATPFANLLMDATASENLYPTDFLISLPEPEGYIGTSRMFGRDRLNADDTHVAGLPVIRRVPEDESKLLLKESKDGATADLADDSSLSSALTWFLMATAARRFRAGKVQHSSMLVNISALSDSHFRTQRRLDDMLDRLRDQLERNSGVLRDRLAHQWADEGARFSAKSEGLEAVEFDAVWDGLKDVLSRTHVVVDNYKSVERLSYSDESPETVVVVGGNTMSRGLTLEGLTSSYFLRQSRTYDTLLQMGRWFGFRPGYGDLIRVWMPKLLEEWFRDLALVEAEIRDEIRKYAPIVVDGEIYGAEVTPLQVGVRIRQHPAMAVVSPQKARFAKQVSLSYAGTAQQTLIFESDDETKMRHNITAVRRLAERSGGPEATVEFASGRRGFRGVSAASVIEFLKDYEVHTESRSFLPPLMTDYIAMENDANALTSWNVVIEGTHIEHAESTVDLGVGSPVATVTRSRRGAVTGGARLGVLAGGGHRLLDLEDPELYAEAMRTKAVSNTDPGAYRFKQKHRIDDGTIVIYPIRKDSSKLIGGEPYESADLAAADHVMGVTIYFPGHRGFHSTVQYIGANLPDLLEEDPEELAEAEELLAADARDEAELSVQKAGSDE